MTIGGDFELVWPGREDTAWKISKFPSRTFHMASCRNIRAWANSSEEFQSQVNPIYRWLEAGRFEGGTLAKLRCSGSWIVRFRANLAQKYSRWGTESSLFSLHRRTCPLFRINDIWKKTQTLLEKREKCLSCSSQLLNLCEVWFLRILMSWKVCLFWRLHVLMITQGQ